MLRADGTTERVVVGPDLHSGQRVQLLISGNTFHMARVIGQRQWFLGASTEWPGVEPADVEIGDGDVLAEKYPNTANDLRAFQQAGAIDLNRLEPPGLRSKCMAGRSASRAEVSGRPGGTPVSDRRI